MAKTVAPLQSFSASGKVGKSIVFFSHLGRNVVRGLVTPRNTKTESQGDVRLLMSALGRAAKVPAFGGVYLADLTQVTPAGQTWVSAMITGVQGLFGKSRTGITALLAAASGHSEAAVFTSEALALGIGDVTIDYAGTPSTIGKGAILYALAAYTMSVKAVNPTLFARTPYTTALASWDSTDVAAFADDLVDVTP